MKKPIKVLEGVYITTDYATTCVCGKEVGFSCFKDHGGKYYRVVVGKCSCGNVFIKANETKTD